jgi:RNA polymerase sigma-70 factor (ECF subfamily)
MNEQRLIDRVKEAQQGKRHALEALYNGFAPLVRAVAFEETRDLHAASDLVQDVFLAVLKNLQRLRRPERFRPWLLSIVRRRIVDLVRTRSRHRKRMRALDKDLPEAKAGPESSGVLYSLHQAIRDLPEIERLAVELFHLERLPVHRVMEILNLPRSTVYAILIRARSRLKKALSKEGITEVSS